MQAPQASILRTQASRSQRFRKGPERHALRQGRHRDPYVFLMPAAFLPNRDLTPGGCTLQPNQFLETDMPDLFFLVAGVGTLAVLALYARALSRL